MTDPNTFVFKFCTVNTLVACPIRIYNFASLHHKIRNNSLNLSPFVKQVVAKLTCAQSSKVLACFWQILVEKLNNYSLFLVTFFAWFPNLDIHPRLYVIFIESWHRPKSIFKLHLFVRVKAFMLILLEGALVVLFHLLLLF